MIVSTPNPVLTKKAKPVKKIDKKARAIINKMKSDLIEADKPKGVGLAAPQIGISLRIFIAKPTAKSKIHTFINPEITWCSEKKSEIMARKNNEEEKRLEGCLSVPNVWGYLKRSEEVKLKYMDENGKTHEEKFTGFLATIIQHEVDHLNGVLFVKRVLEQNNKLYRIEKNSKGEDKLMEMEL